MSDAKQEKRDARILRIRSDIERYGLSITMVSGGPLPRYAYTIGLRDVLGFELVAAGGAYYNAGQIHRLLNTAGRSLRQSPGLPSVQLAAMGSFSFGPVHSSWSRPLLLAAADYFDESDVPAVQVVPHDEHRTIDVPNMGEPWSGRSEPVWRWVGETWQFPVSAQSVAMTNLAALRGSPVTEFARWEESEWEIFAGPGPDVTPDQARAVPLGTLLGFDRTLERALQTPVGSGCWREGGGSPWNEWKKKADSSSSS